MGIENLKALLQNKQKQKTEITEDQHKIINMIKEKYEIAYRDFVSCIFSPRSDSYMEQIIAEQIDANDSTFTMPLELHVPFVELEDNRLYVSPGSVYLYGKVIGSSEVVNISYNKKIPMDDVDYLEEDFEILNKDYIDYTAINALDSAGFRDIAESIEMKLTNYGFNVIKVSESDRYFDFSSRTLHLNYKIKVKIV